MDEFIEVLTGVLANSGIHHKSQEKIIETVKRELARREAAKAERPKSSKGPRRKFGGHSGD